MNREASSQFTFKAFSLDISKSSNILDTRQISIENKSKIPTRKHKIFQKNALFYSKRYTFINKNQINYENENNQKVNKNMNIKHQGNLNDSIQQLIDKKIGVNLNASSSNSYKEQILQQLQRKQRQVRILKLQLERLKRCQNLSKNNQLLYKRLMEKMNSISKQHSQDGNKKDTPIHSLTEIYFTPHKQPLQISRLEEGNTKEIRYGRTQPLKTIPQHQEHHLITEQHPESPHLQSTNKKNRQAKPKIDSAKFQLTSNFQRDPMYLKIQSQMNASRNRYHSSIKNLPVNVRLKEMNRNLQGHCNDRTTRYHSQKKQTTYYQSLSRRS